MSQTPSNRSLARSARWRFALPLAAALTSAAAAVAPAPLWLAHGQPSHQAIEMSGLLSGSDRYGLRPQDYDAAWLASEVAHLAGGDSALTESNQFEQRMTIAATRLIQDLHYGRIDPRAVGFELGAKRSDLDIIAVVRRVARSQSVADTLAGIEPAFYHYALLERALARYRRLALDPALGPLPDIGKHPLRAGALYAGAAALRYRLQAEGDLPASTGAADANRLDGATMAGLQQFQQRMGLHVAAALDARTLAALNVPLAARVRQIELTLERWRWLPPFAAPPVIVNIPQYRLFAFSTTADRAASLLQMPVIVGRNIPTARTPVFMGSLRELVFRPYWDIPRDIMLSEMLPAIRRNPDYLEHNQLDIVSGESDSSPVLAPTPAAIDALAAGQARLRQRPGDDNALGLLKFVFPNAHNVYMHDTPVHRLFLESRRTFSHGCIRLSEPVALAALVLRNEPGDWTEERIRAAMHGPDAYRVHLTHETPVLILYGTALATEAGPVQFFEDVYGHDARLAALLHLPPLARQR